MLSVHSVFVCLLENAMTATTEPTTIITARIPRTVRADLEALARATGQDQDALIHEALRRFTETERRHVSFIEERLRQADAGDFATDEEMAELYTEFNIPVPRPTRPHAS
jgi:RHH-type transcriptional regulator, rel operon repressor / antitoxin RelB